MVQRSSEVHLEFTDQLSKQPGPPLPAVVLFRKKRQVDWAVAALLSGFFAHLSPPKALTFALATLVFAAGTSMLL